MRITFLIITLAIIGCGKIEPEQIKEAPAPPNQSAPRTRLENESEEYNAALNRLSGHIDWEAEWRKDTTENHRKIVDLLLMYRDQEEFERLRKFHDFSSDEWGTGIRKYEEWQRYYNKPIVDFKNEER